MDDSKHSVTVTTNNISGTQGWMPPQILSALNVEQGLEHNLPKMTPKTDIFALGCLFYYVLSGGEHPFGQPIFRNAHILAGSASFLSKQPYAMKSTELVRRMIDPIFSRRPKCSEILSDTFFSPSKQSVIVDETNSLVRWTSPETHSDEALTTWEKFYIYLMRDDLQKNTVVSELFIDKILHCKVLTERQIRMYLEIMNKTANLYVMQFKTPNTYKLLMDILYETSQIYAFKILQRGICYSETDEFLKISHAIATKQSVDSLHEMIHRFSPQNKCEGLRNISLLHVSVGCGHVEMIKTLKEKGYSFQDRDVCDYTPLHYLGKWSYANVVEVTKTLVEMNINIDVLNCWQQTMAHPLAHYGVSSDVFHEWIEFLVAIKKESLIVRRDKNGDTCLNIALKHFDVMDKTIELLKCIDFPVNTSEISGRTPLHLAVRSGRSISTIKALLVSGANWEIKDKKNRSVLHFAVWGGNVEAIEYFVNLGADVNARDVFDRTPLHYLRYALVNHIDVTKMMLHHKADIYAVDKYGDTPAHDYEDTWKRNQQIFERWAHFLVENGHRKLLEGLKNKDGHVPMSLSWINR